MVIWRIRNDVYRERRRNRAAVNHPPPSFAIKSQLARAFILNEGKRITRAGGCKSRGVNKAPRAASSTTDEQVRRDPLASREFFEIETTLFSSDDYAEPRARQCRFRKQFTRYFKYKATHVSYTGDLYCEFHTSYCMKMTFGISALHMLFGISFR